QRRLDEDVPVPTIAELGDTLHEGVIEQLGDSKAIMARQIQDEIIERLRHGKSIADLLLLGWVYQFWHKNQHRPQKDQRCPTVAEIAKLMGLSRGSFYRRYTSADLNKAYFVASGESK